MKTSSKHLLMVLAQLAALQISLPDTALAADYSDTGKNEYNAACAVCHGSSGKGNGPMQSQLVNRVPDLTVLAKNNNGVFPSDRVQKIIDGREYILSHGTREMPVWGFAFSSNTSIYYKENPPFNTEHTVHSRILALTEYLNRLQAK